ncbi:iron permease [Rhodocollybia butyracea]|uniref:Iron permease n=1 Tax=Rhodocollybia butyracea TaxID=206335 RepID=A0A9P5PVT8_9AGAR|nr:iron permease [Rhodocollybia butyracea]
MDDTHLGSQENTSKYERGTRFWLVITACIAVELLSALDLTSISTALPTIVHDLEGFDFIWAASAYSIASTAVLPLVGGLVTLYGRKPILLCFIGWFALGSTICGAAQNLNMLVARRAIQGLGGGGCISVTDIVITDLVPLSERGKFQGIIATVWALACAVGPPVGGALASSGAWRWLFFMNLPICALSATLVLLFLKVHTPKATVQGLLQMDWIGLPIVIGGTMSVILALTWGGIRFPWSSVQVLAPLSIGSIAIACFFVIEARYIKEPMVPPFLFLSRTTLSGYLGVFFHGIASMAVIFYLPIYFQATKLTNSIRSGIDLFGTSFTIPVFAIGTGVFTTLVGRYRPQNYVGWTIITVGFGVLSLLEQDSSPAAYIGFQILLGAGLGIVWISAEYPILAPLPYSNNAHALAFLTFTRSFAQTWGSVIGGAILQNGLQERLPKSFLSTLPRHTQFTYSLVPLIPNLPSPLQDKVRLGFSQSLRIVWWVMCGISGVGLLSCLLMDEIPLRADRDETWGLDQPHVGEDTRNAGTVIIIEGQNESKAKVEVEVRILETTL